MTEGTAEAKSTFMSQALDRLARMQDQHPGATTEDKREIPSEVRDCFRVIPVTTTLFANRYMNMTLFPRQQEFVDGMIGADPWRWDREYQIGLAWWGMGGGKDTVITFLQAYLIYWLLCLRDVHKWLGVSASDRVDLVNVSVTGRQAKDVYWRQFKETLRHVVDPITGRNIFGQNWGLDLDDDHGCLFSNEARFPGNIRAHSLNSEKFTAEGMCILLGVIDELGNMPVATGKALYEFLRKNITSRFPGGLGKLAAMSYMIDENDAMSITVSDAQQRWAQYRAGESTVKPNTLISHYATWEVNLKRSKEEFLMEYLEDELKAMMAYECRTKGGSVDFKRWIPNPAIFLGALNRQKPIAVDSTRTLKGLPIEPWFQGIPGVRYAAHVDLALGDDQSGQDSAGFALSHAEEMTTRIDEDHLRRVCEGLGVQLDAMLKVTSRCNFCGTTYQGAKGKCDGCGSTTLYVQTTKVYSDKVINTISALNLRCTCQDCGHVAKGYVPACPKCNGIHLERNAFDWGVINDLAVRIQAPKGQEVQFDDIIDFIVALRDERGFNVAMVSYDGWQSIHSRQILERKGFKADLYSLDKTMEAWDTMKGMIHTGRWSGHRNAVLEREAAEVYRAKGKIDHPKESRRRAAEEGVKKGSKDVLDAVVGSGFKALQYKGAGGGAFL